MKSISEFIQEQNTGYYDEDYELDSSYVKEYAECMIAKSLVNCYYEQLSLLEFAEENGIQSLSIFTESEEEVNKTGLMKRIGNGIKDAWGKLIELIRKLCGAIKGFFTGRKAKQKAESIKNEVNTISETGHGSSNTSSTTTDVDKSKTTQLSSISKYTPITPSTKMDEVISNDNNSLTEVDARFVLLLTSMSMCFIDLSGVLFEIANMCSSNSADDAKDYIEHMKRSHEKYKNDKSHYDSLIDAPLGKVTFGEFQSYVNDMNEEISNISKTKSDIDKYSSTIKSYLSSITKDTKKTTYIKNQFSSAEKEYNKMIKAYDKLVSLYNKQKTKTERK